MPAPSAATSARRRRARGVDIDDDDDARAHAATSTSTSTKTEDAKRRRAEGDSDRTPNSGNGNGNGIAAHTDANAPAKPKRALADALADAFARLPPRRVDRLRHPGLAPRTARAHHAVLDFAPPTTHVVLWDGIETPVFPVDLAQAHAHAHAAPRKAPPHVVFEIPSSCFARREDADHVDHRFHAKRALFLDTLLAACPLSDHDARVIEDVDGRAWIQLDPTSGASSTSIRFTAVPSIDAFPPRRLAPRATNARDPETGAPLASPRYNARLLEECATVASARALRRAAESAPGFRAALDELARWLRRDSTEAEGLWEPGAVRPAAVGLALAALARHERLHAASAEALVERALHFLASLDPDARPVVRLPADPDSSASPDLEDVFADDAFSASFALSLLDPSGRVNLTWRAHAGSVRRVAERAADALRARRSRGSATTPPGGDGFWHSADRFVRVCGPAPGAFDARVPEEAAAEIEGVAFARHVADRAEELARRGLVGTGRARNVRVAVTWSSAARAWAWSPADESVPRAHEPGVDAVVAIQLDADKAFRVLDRGPDPDEDPDAATAFRALWGDKAELRKFKDGTIVEAVVWPETSRKRVPELALAHLAATHPPFSRCAAPPPLRTRSVSSFLDELDDDDRESSRAREAINAFNELQSAALDVSKDACPLTVLSLRPDAPELRYAGVRAPTPHELLARGPPRATSAVSRRVPCMDAWLEFERSSKWPRDPEAVRHTETALWIALARALERQGVATACAVDADPARESQSLVVVSPAAYAFRFRLAMRGEARDAERRARIHAHLHALHGSAQNYALGSVTRLLKRWIAAHALSHHVPDVFAELVCASLFAGESGAESTSESSKASESKASESKARSSSTKPRGVLSGLLRAFHVLERHDWRDRPLVVDVSGATAHDPKQLARLSRDAERALASARATPGGATFAMTACTPEDVAGLGGETPDDAEEDASDAFWGVRSDKAAARVVDLARKSRTLLERLCRLDATAHERVSPAMWRSLFATPTSFFDAVLHVDVALADELTRVESASEFKNLQRRETDAQRAERALFDFDPIAVLVAELERFGFGAIADLFFGVGETRPAFVGVVWRAPPTSAEFHVATTALCAAPDPDARGRVSLNVAQVLDEMARVGRGLVVRVEVMRG